MMTSERDVYERIVQLERLRTYDVSTEEMLTLGLIHYYKWDKVVEWEKSHPGDHFSSEKLHEFLHQYTELDLNDRRARARDTLRDYADRLQHGQKFWGGVWQGFIAAFLYSVFLIVMYYVLKHSNLDLFTLLGVKT